ncbi:hypothetical protein CNMCM7691_007113 [Aspergillus felis]|uniref:Uncharacterized protein n=1 Tax=Aspergillus felis TaxID=1287682 RepID=A0A8H6R5E2_9EURO|nr:hypothetical protein CNMCM7691_007113 [Aspergillus felis]
MVARSRSVGMCRRRAVGGAQVSARWGRAVASWPAELARWEAPRGGAGSGVDGNAHEGSQLAGFQAAAARARVASWPGPLGQAGRGSRAPRYREQPARPRAS